MAYKFLPPSYRTARTARIGDQVEPDPYGENWNIIATINDRGQRLQFIFTDGADMWVEPQRRIYHQRIPKEG
jgi:hypothetical protein